MRGSLFIVSAPSGAGKTTLIRRLLERVHADADRLAPTLHFSVSHTTRQPRPGEKDGIDYHFVDREQFDAMVGRGEFLEYAPVHQNFYGTSKLEVLERLEQGIDVVLDIDVVGARQIRASALPSVGIFVLPPSYEALKERLFKRASDEPRAIERRLARAIGEIEEFGEYDYAIINEDLDLSCSVLEAIILERRYRITSQREAIDRLIRDFKKQEVSTENG